MIASLMSGRAHVLFPVAYDVLQGVAPSLGVPLVTPRRGEPLEPSRAEAPEAWWRSVSAHGAVEPVDETDALESEAPLEWMPD